MDVGYGKIYAVRSLTLHPPMEGAMIMGKDLKGKELGKGISQRKDGRYHARFTNRFGNRESVYGDTIKEIKNKLAKAKANDVNRKNVISPNVKLDEWYDKWMEVYKIPVVKETTRLYYHRLYTQKISPVLGRQKLSDITKLQITDLMNRLKDQGYKWETLNKAKRILVDMFERALEDDFVNKNPAKGVRLPMNKSKNSYRVLTKSEQEDFLEASAGHFYHNLFLVALNTGIRPGEIFALTEADLDFKKKVISVNKTLTYEKFEGDKQKEFHIGTPKTEGSTREVPMNEICKNALYKQIMQANVIRNRIKSTPTKVKRQKEFENLLFTTKFGTPINPELLCEAIDRIRVEMNLMRDEFDQIEKFSGHSLRHTFATRCFEAGIQPKTVQAYLGHATLAMTMDLYTSVMDEKKQDDMLLLQEYTGTVPQEVDKYANNIIRLYA